MIVVWGLELGEAIIRVIFTILNVLPAIPVEMISTIDWYFDFLMQGIDLFALFVDMDMVRLLIPVVISILLFDEMYQFIMWVIKKIPFLNIK